MHFKKGFSLIEICLVSALFVIILAIGLPFGINSYRNYLMIFETRSVVTILRHAQVLAMTNTYESPFGVAFLENQMILFLGNSYDVRNQTFDEIYPRSTAIGISAPSEIVFQPMSDNPSASSSIVLGSGSKNVNIDINSHGTIDW